MIVGISNVIRIDCASAIQGEGYCAVINNARTGEESGQFRAIFGEKMSSGLLVRGRLRSH